MKVMAQKIRLSIYGAELNIKHILLPDFMTLWNNMIHNVK